MRSDKQALGLGSVELGALEQEALSSEYSEVYLATKSGERAKEEEEEEDGGGGGT